MSEPIESLAAELRAAYPELEAIAARAEAPVHLVGGAVRDLLLGRGRSENLDLVIVGDPTPLAIALGGDERIEHERFSTATVTVDGLEIDIAAARTESYPEPGALPVVEPVDEIAADLARRDFTVNAMAVPLGDGATGSGTLVDPHGGRADLDAGVLRVLHPRSFEDDPTRALRAARYAARLDLALEEETETLLRRADLETISGDRREAELLRLAAEPRAARGFELLADWGLLKARPGGIELAAAVSELLEKEPWAVAAPRNRAILAAAIGPPGAEVELSHAEPVRPSDAVELAATCSPIELALARALGAAWLDRYMEEWRSVALEIDGGDLIAAGVPEGPAVGRGLDSALRLKLDGELDGGRSEELAVALRESGADDGVA